jgi:hypothetical protein
MATSGIDNLVSRVPHKIRKPLEVHGECELRQGIKRQSFVEFFEDFHGDVTATLPASWSYDGETANITGDFVSEANGVYEILTDSTSEGQAGRLNWGDTLMVNLSKNPIFEVRAKLAMAGATLTADERMVIGLGSALATAEATLDDVTTHVWFRVEGADNDVMVEGDDGTTDTDDQAGGTDLVDDTFTVFTIDCGDLSAVRFYLNGVSIGTVDISAVSANTLVQPIICIQRDAGTEVNSLKIDYVKVVQERT